MAMALLALLLLTALSSPIFASFGAAAAAPASSQVPSIPLSLGFGPSSVSPISAGIPIYTVGDTVWVSSGFASSVSVSLTYVESSVPAETVVTTSLAPQTITPLYTFVSGDTDGVWNLTVANGTESSVVPVHFVNPADHIVSLGPLQYSLSGGDISISAPQADLADSYDQEICAAGTAGTTAPKLGLPTGMRDKGSLTLIPGSPFTIEVSGIVNESASFWFELYHPFGLFIDSANTVETDELMAASSQPTILATNANATTTLTWDTALRAGRYEVRAYFQNASSLDVVQSQVLIVNDSSWVSLSSSCQPETIHSQSINYSEPLSSDSASWPKTLYFMYRTFGVESFVSLPVDANVSSTEFIASPWNQPLQDATIDVSPFAAGVVQTSQVGSSLFVLASTYPVVLNYSLDIGGTKSNDDGLTISGNGNQTTTVDTAKLVVRVQGGQGSVGSTAATVDVAGSNGLNITEGAKGGQPLSFVIPAGSYTVTASQGGASQTTQINLSDGVETTLSLTLSTLPTLEIILVITAVIGVIGDVLVWAFRSRRPTLKLSPPR